MDNLKYYNDSFAYDYDKFMSSRPQKAEIHEYPKKRRRTHAKKAFVLGSATLVRNFVVSFMVLAAVFGSLYLRAEISSIKSQVNDVNKEIVALESEVTRLDVEIGRKISLSNLEEAARELGMQKCEKSQVTYIMTNEIDTAENSGGKLTAEVE